MISHWIASFDRWITIILITTNQNLSVTSPGIWILIAPRYGSIPFPDAPWCQNTYQHLPHQSPRFVRKYSSPMEHPEVFMTELGIDQNPFPFRILQVHPANATCIACPIRRNDEEQPFFIWLVLTGTWLFSTYIGNFIIPTEERIFLRGVGLNHQWVMARVADGRARSLSPPGSCRNLVLGSRHKGMALSASGRWGFKTMGRMMKPWDLSWVESEIWKYHEIT